MDEIIKSSKEASISKEETEQTVDRTVSYFHKGSTVPLLGITYRNVIDSAEKYINALAIIDKFKNIRKTYKEYLNDVNEISLGLLALNMNKGDVIGIWSPNCYEWALVQMAAAKAGLILVAINPALRVAEVSYILKQSQTKVLVIPESFKTQNYYEMMCEIVSEIRQTKQEQKVQSKA
ncbi:hypothetical protein CHUAL_012374 [Chamberlinius hualienensis]